MDYKKKYASSIHRIHGVMQEAAKHGIENLRGEMYSREFVMATIVMRDGGITHPTGDTVNMHYQGAYHLDHIIPQWILSHLDCPDGIIDHIDNIQILQSHFNLGKGKHIVRMSSVIMKHEPHRKDLISQSLAVEDRAIRRIRIWHPNASWGFFEWMAEEISRERRARWGGV